MAYLGHAEVGEDEAARAGRSPNEEDLDFETSVSGADIDEVRGGVANTEVPEPVAGD